jgi:cytochrome c oxidase subunit 2
MVVLMTRVLLFIVGIGGALAAMGSASGSAQSDEGKPQQTVDVAAERFMFTPSEIRTRTGTVLTIRLTSDDTAHGFRIIGSNVNVEIPKRSRGTTTVTFTPQKSGRYTFECSRLCGAGHSFMRGVIVAEDASEAQR